MSAISADQLQDGDVVLYHGHTLLARAIRLIDGTRVNHAAVFVSGKNVVEALSKGLTKNPFAKSIKSNDYVVIKRLSSNPGTMQPVVSKAEEYLTTGSKYGYDQILLLAFLGITRKAPINVYLKWLLRKVLDQAADLLTAKGKGQPMICSEFVYRCYEEALPTSSDIYSLGINQFPVASAIKSAAGFRAEAAPHRLRMHPDSLLAWAEDLMAPGRNTKGINLALSFEGRPRAMAKLPLNKKEKKLSIMSLNQLLDAYLQEVKKPMSATFELEASLRTPEMLSGIKKFTEAYYSASVQAPRARGVSWSARVAEGNIPEALSHALDTVADFVTPGDLLKCGDLFDLGEITPV